MNLINQKLSLIQAGLIAPKDSRNTFGNYNYRSCESILQSLKPHLAQHGCTLTLSDDIVPVEGRVYVRATVTLRHENEVMEVTALAREAMAKKGMDEAQVTGAASSYARKYALCGLFAIDDNADPDALNVNANYTQEPEPQPTRNPNHAYNNNGIRILRPYEFDASITLINDGKFDAEKLLDTTMFDLTEAQRKQVESII